MRQFEADQISIPGMTRRTLLGTAASFGMAGGAAVSRPARAQGAPRKGGTLRFCRPDPPDTLDPQMTNSFSGMEYSQMVYDNLVSLDADTQPVPMLATAWAPEAGGAEWVVTLREGVKFHNGRAFTSADVVATVERSMDPARSGVGSGDAGGVSVGPADGLGVAVGVGSPAGSPVPPVHPARPMTSARARAGATGAVRAAVVVITAPRSTVGGPSLY